MAAYSVNPGRMLMCAQYDATAAQAIELVRPLLDEARGAAEATGSSECAAMFAAFCTQWSDEIRREAEGLAARSANLYATSSLYELTEELAVLF